MYGGFGGYGGYAATSCATVGGSWWGVGAIATGTLILIAIGVVFLGGAL
ncbi:MAG: hypothetical protein M0Z55_05390 [Peptococcaceae bacterium]|nr:hypothetical protein [Peptococcaceae bacterium]